jgi:uncharacterized iron-regulated membrane protein
MPRLTFAAQSSIVHAVLDGSHLPYHERLDNIDMTPYRICWQLHKWIGIVLSVVLVNLSVTGLLLLEKKRYEWIQPATRTGQEGTPAEFVSMQRVLKAVSDCNHPDFPDVDNIDRVDFRPGNRVYKVIAKTNQAEIQVDAVTGHVLSVSTRPSDFLEKLHDGSYLGEWMHAGVMPMVAVGNVLLAISGFYLWLGPKCKKTKTRVNAK